MTRVECHTQINAPVEEVYEYYTNPNNIQEAWPRDIVKESEDVSGSKDEEGSQMRVKGQYMGKEEEMRLQVVDKEEIWEPQVMTVIIQLEKENTHQQLILCHSKSS
jgi:uncharacterized protein YndB with AHSA1/START domain